MSSGDDEFFEKTNIFNTGTHKIEISSDPKIPACLVLLVGPAEQKGRQWVLDKPELILGRNPTSDIHIAEASLSKTHARFHFNGKQAMVTDLGSTNKTFVEGQVLTPHQAHPIKNNDQIRAGGLVFKYLEQGLVSETAEKERMQTELAKARTIQASLFPLNSEMRYGWVQVGGVYRQATEIGGDWWWHWSRGDKVFALIGDATGHGASAGLITSAARSAVATIEDDPSVGLEKVYSVLTNAIQKCSGGQMAMSAFLVEIGRRSKILRYINASHLPAVLLPKDQEIASWRNLEPLAASLSSPLGATSAKLEVSERALSGRGRIVLYTDGLSERLTADGQELSERAFGTMLLKGHTAYAESQADFLNDLLKQSDDLAAAQPLQDDITIVALDFE